MFCTPNVLCSLNCVTESIQVTEGCKYFPQRLHIEYSMRSKEKPKFFTLIMPQIKAQNLSEVRSASVLSWAEMEI